MSHNRGRPVTDEPTAVHIFGKRLREKSCSPAHTVQDVSAVSFSKKTVRTLKVKRLKSRKERSQGKYLKRQGTREGFRHYSNREGRPCTCCSCSHLLPKATLLHQSVSKQESCIITDNRLIGHRGLFSREVKSVDIERLFGDQNNEDTGRGGEPAAEDSETDRTASHQDGNKQRPSSSVREKGTDPRTLPSQSAGNEPFVLSSSDKPSDKLSDESNKVISLASELDKDPQKSETSARKRKLEEKTVSVSSPLQLFKDFEVERNQVTAGGSTLCVGERSLLGAGNSSPALVASVASRLGRSLNIPLLHRRDLLLESREGLQNALQERHGSPLQENLLALLHSLSFRAEREERACSAGVTGCHELSKAESRTALSCVDSVGVPACSSEGCLRGTDEPQDSFHSPFLKKRRRKQKHPQKIAAWLVTNLPKTVDTAITSMVSSAVKHTRSDLDEISRTHSLEVFMDFPPPFAVSSAPPRGPQFAWAEQSDQRASNASPLKTWAADCDSVCPSHAEVLKRNRLPFFTFSDSDLGSMGRDWDHLPQFAAEREKGGLYECTSPPVCGPCLSHCLQPDCSSSSRPSTSSEYKLDIKYYPPSELLERGFSPPGSCVPFHTSPECWSYPRMRLY